MTRALCSRRPHTVVCASCSCTSTTAMSAATSEKAADANVGVVPYETSADDRNGQDLDKAAAKPQPSGAMSRKAALSAYMTIAAAAFGLISDGCTSSHLSYVLCATPTPEGKHRPEQSFDHGQCQSLSKNFPALVSAVTDYLTPRPWPPHKRSHRSSSRSSIPRSTRPRCPPVYPTLCL